MIELPIGENFERFVDWLKESFEGFFNLISDVLDFSITLLENLLLLNSEAPEASILFGLLLALLFGLLAKKFFGAKALLPVALATGLIFGAAEYWRLQSLAEEVDTEVAEAMATDFGELEKILVARAPEDFDATEQILERSAEAFANLPKHAEELSDAAEDALREVSRARSGDFDDVYDALSELREAMQEYPANWEAELEESLEAQRLYYHSLTLIEESNRLIDDFEEVDPAEGFERKNDFINVRSFLELSQTFKQSIAAYGNDAELGLVLRQTQAHLKSLNPDRLSWYPPIATILLLMVAAYLIAGRNMVIFALIGFPLILSMEMWVSTMETLALVISATLFALLIGVPTGIATARSEMADRMVRPILDFMQTMPAFVYLIPAVIFFGLGKVPGAMATLIFAMPPAVRLTSLGIRQVPGEVVEAAQSFGATGSQLLFKAQLPIAMPTILAGVNQTIMLALSMVVIGGMIGAGGLGEDVLSGITQMKLGLGFEGGIAVVILAIYLDRVTQALGNRNQ